jgi:hypothetical protein
MKTYGWVHVQINVFLASTLVGGEWAASRTCRVTPGKRAPGLVYMEKWKFLTIPWLELRPLGRPAWSHLLYRLRYRSNHCNWERRIWAHNNYAMTILAQNSIFSLFLFALCTCRLDTNLRIHKNQTFYFRGILYNLNIWRLLTPYEYYLLGYHLVLSKFIGAPEDYIVSIFTV